MSSVKLGCITLFVIPVKTGIQLNTRPHESGERILDSASSTE